MLVYMFPDSRLEEAGYAPFLHAPVAPDVPEAKRTGLHHRGLPVDRVVDTAAHRAHPRFATPSAQIPTLLS